MLDMLDKILELLENKDFPQLGNLLKDMNPADVAELFEDLPREKMALVFRLLPKELAADAFAYMNPDEQTVLVEAFSDKELHDVVNELYVDDAADMIEEMPANLVKRILRHTDAETRVLINQILNYPKDSAGSIMTMEYVDLKRGMTVEEAFDRIRAIGVEKETVYTCYVTDSRRKLKGIVTVKDLLLAPKNELIRNIMKRTLFTFPPIPIKKKWPPCSASTIFLPCRSSITKSALWASSPLTTRSMLFRTRRRKISK